MEKINNENNTEIEIKLTTVSQAALDSIFGLPMIQKRLLLETERQKYLESHYYDTPGRKFAKAGIVFRVRKEPDGYIATVKLEKKNSGGLSERMEYNVRLPDEQPAFDGFGEINFLVNLEELAAKDGGLEELFCVAVQRLQCELVLTEATIVEMAVDTGEIIADEQTLPVCEVEFELKQGTNQDLIEFIAQLSQQVPLFAEQKSKYFRGVQLAGEKVQLSKATAVREIAADKPFKDAVLDALRKQLGYALSCVQDSSHNEKLLPLLCESLLTLEQMLLFACPLFNEPACAEQSKKIQTIVAEVQTSFLVAEFAGLWQEVNEKTASVHTTALLQKLLEEKRTFYQSKVQQNLGQGSYSAQLFAVWSWLETADWRNNIEVTGKTYLAEQFAALHDKAIALYNKNEIQKLCALLATITCTSKLMKKFAGKDTKHFTKTAQALHKQLAGKCAEEKRAKLLFSLLRTAAGRLLYRDAGILLGYYFASFKYKQEKIEKRFAQFSQAKKILVLNEAQPEAEIADED